MAAETSRSLAVLLRPAPLPRRPPRAGGLMWQVIYALLPAAGLGLYVYGAPALLVLVSCLAGALAGEGLGLLLWRRGRPLLDGSALLSGLLLALTLPPGLSPGWAFLGGAAGLLLGRQLLGGLGLNLLNPALCGRLVVALAAPTALQGAWLKPFWWREGGWFAAAPTVADPWPLVRETHQLLRRLTQGEMPALPASWPAGERLDLIRHAQDLLATVDPGQLFWPRLPGLLGEASLLALLPGLIWLFTARLVDWRIPAAALLVLVAALLAAPGEAAGLGLDLALPLRGCGLLLLLCVFASDPVTTPLGQSAKLCFGLMVAAGCLLVLLAGGSTSGLFWVVLAAGLATPWLDRLLLPRGPR